MFTVQILINTIVFGLGLVGVLVNRFNILLVLVSLEVMFLGVDLMFITFSYYLNDFYGQIFILFIITITGCESVVGLAIVILFNRIRRNISTLPYTFLKN